MVLARSRGCGFDGFFESSGSEASDQDAVWQADVTGSVDHSPTGSMSRRSASGRAGAVLADVEVLFVKGSAEFVA